MTRYYDVPGAKLETMDELLNWMDAYIPGDHLMAKETLRKMRDDWSLAKELFDRSQQWMARGLCEGAYKDTCGGDGCVERLMEHIDMVTGNRKE